MVKKTCTLYIHLTITKNISDNTTTSFSSVLENCKSDFLVDRSCLSLMCMGNVSSICYLKTT